MTSRKFSFEKILHFPIDKGVAEQITHRNVEERAYFLWLESGKPEGRDQEFWLRAEKEINSAHQGAQLQPSPPHPSNVSGNTPENLILVKSTPREFRIKNRRNGTLNPQSRSRDIFQSSLSLSKNPITDSTRSSEDMFMDQLFGSVFEEVDFDGLFNTCVNSP